MGSCSARVVAVGVEVARGELDQGWSFGASAAFREARNAQVAPQDDGRKRKVKDPTLAAQGWGTRDAQGLIQRQEPHT